MDKETARELIALIDSKIERLQQSKRDILRLLSEDAKQLDLSVGDPPSHSTGNGASETTRRIHEVMVQLNRNVTPKELFGELKKTGLDLPDARVRQILMRWKGRLFRVVKRGQWRAIKHDI